jgi:predicted DNA-binding transcriptional regulator
MLDTTPLQTESRPYAKWGEAAIAGWQALPDVLLKNQHKLELTPTELVVLINVLSFWWYVEDLPFPRITTLAKRMNVTDRTVQRCLKQLIQRGLLERKTDIGRDGKMREVLNPDGLVAALKKLAVVDPAFRHRQGQHLKGMIGEADGAEIPF